LSVVQFERRTQRIDAPSRTRQQVIVAFHASNRAERLRGGLAKHQGGARRGWRVGRAALLREIKPLAPRQPKNGRSATSKRTMTYRSLLVHLDQDPQCAARSEAAIRLARSLDCHLVGLAPTGLIDMPAFTQPAASLTEFAALAWDALRDRAHLAAHRFRTECEAAGLKSFEAVIDESEEALSLVRHAHCSDLTLLTQANPTSPGHSWAQAIVEQVVLHSARPTLVLPYAGRFDSIGANVLVAWDDSREAARALSDALPLLLSAKRVQVIGWNEHGAAEDKTLQARLDALHKWLMWHGVAAEVSVETTDIGIAESMLSRAADIGADLIVMGAYGHARLAERVLGGATRGLLASMTVPVLMSH
jgi:nucleotide-binding universal stress UspA family protein